MTRPAADAATLQALCQQGLAHHQAGRLAEASQVYEQVLAADPRHFDALHFLGVQRIQTGRLEEAVDLIGRATAIRADVPGAFGNLANALNGLRRFDEAVAAAGRALALTPDFAEAHGNRGRALRELGRLEEAAESYGLAARLKPTPQAHFNHATALRDLGRLSDALAGYDRALALRADYAEAHRSRGVVLGELGRPREALAAFEQATAARADYAEAWISHGAALRELGRAQDALASLERAIALRPTAAEAHGARGNVLNDLRRPAEALESYALAVSLKPDYVEALNNQAAPLRALGRPQDALAAADRALALRPEYAEAHLNRGGALYDLRRLEEALKSYDRALVLKPDYPEAYDNRGVVFHELRRPDDAMASYDRALALRPDFADAHHDQAMCRLMLGDFAGGWAQYEWRWRTDQLGWRDLGAAAPLWLGEGDIAGRTILLRAEQGLGDTLQFCRYARDVAARGASVILQVQPGLEHLLVHLEGVTQVITRGAPTPPHDLQAPLMSLPLALGAGTPKGAPYLDADPDAAAEWTRRLAGDGALRVGLCWAGGVRPDQFVAHSIDKRRSLPLEAFAPLAEIEGLSFYSLQKGPPAAQLAELETQGWTGPAIVDRTSELSDFADTAALVANLDLVVTCDTAVAHLAGALGKPVWILNRFDACWRWLDGRDDSPWYDSARLFRQPAPGDWQSVMIRVRDGLGELAATVVSH